MSAATSGQRLARELDTCSNLFVGTAGGHTVVLSADLIKDVIKVPNLHFVVTNRVHCRGESDSKDISNLPGTHGSPSQE